MSPFKVLLVDDDPYMRHQLAYLLSHRAHFEIVEANHGVEALAILAKTHFDFIVTDHHMPRMTGLEFIAAARPSNPNTPILLYSADSNVVATAQAQGLPAMEKSASGLIQIADYIWSKWLAKASSHPVEREL